MSWLTAVEKVIPYVVKIQTPDGYGTGVMFAYNKDKSVVAIGTASHVVEHAEEWKQAIKVATEAKKTRPTYLKDSERVIYLDRPRDSATILFTADKLELPEHPLPLVDKEEYLSLGTAVGWLGYPGLYPSSLCFFRGYVSAFLNKDDCYLVDGVAINGVSGGPLFTNGANPELVGVVSAYHPNRQSDVVLPGLLRAQDFTHMHDVLQTIKSVDEARERKAETSSGSTSSSERPVDPEGASESPNLR